MKRREVLVLLLDRIELWSILWPLVLQLSLSFIMVSVASIGFSNSGKYYMVLETYAIFEFNVIQHEVPTVYLQAGHRICLL